MGDINALTGLRIPRARAYEILTTARWSLKKLTTESIKKLLEANMSSKQRPCSPVLDRDFGPVVACQDFDFTLAFELSIFDIGVSSLFIILLPFCLWLRLRTPRQTFGRPLYPARVVGIPCVVDTPLLTCPGLVDSQRCIATGMSCAMVQKPRDRLRYCRIISDPGQFNWNCNPASR